MFMLHIIFRSTIGGNVIKNNICNENDIFVIPNVGDIVIIEGVNYKVSQRIINIDEKNVIFLFKKLLQMIIVWQIMRNKEELLI